jgi:tetratricopeptide (TPR) repeat protein
MKQLRNRSNRWERPFLPLFIVILLFLTACGGEADTAEVTVAAPETAVVDEAPTPTPVPEPTPTLTAVEHLDRAEALANAENFDEAIVELQAVLDQEPDNADALAVLGGIHLTQEKIDEAIAELNQALSIEVAHPLALSNLCGALALQGADNALDICQQALAANPEEADVYNALGIIYGRLGQYDEAVAAFEEAIRLEPEHNWAHNNLGSTYISMEQFDESVVELTEAVRITPDNAKAHYNLGLAYAKSEQYEQAIPAYQEALRYDPSVVTAYIELGIVYTRLGQPEDAIANFETYLELAPDADNREAVEAEIARLNAAGSLDEGIALVEAGDWAGAVAFYDEIIAANPDMADAYVKRSIPYRLAGNLDQAFADVNQAISLQSDLAEAYFERGIILASVGRLEEAVADFNQAILLQPDYADAYNHRGLVYAQAGNLSQALADMNEAVLLQPENPHYLVNRATGLALNGDVAAARADLEAAITLDEEYGRAYYNRAQLNVATKQYDTLVDDLLRAVAYSSEPSDLNDTLDFWVQLELPFIVDYENPTSVLLTVFHAAASGDYANLSLLCDPLGENDGDTAMICEVTADHEMAGDFGAYFGNGRINGPLTINDDHAELPFLFGPDADQAETMNFILRDGKWYLFDF